ncbi:hypothetical protein TVAG_020250 [Trichomonas vaginalis G3]|uniref:Serine/threonine-protein phosphatase 4 regulatory subunit 3-like central domain-containing protein n=1 Tax=Trichomonas vaginalis (strain ATCC PRA-98 / G3) TaxID=412133 RepID=A2EQ14_TRIV3|nr:hypothetical protein TVAGG3_0338880 [Trichomonas vaginalis G3]EAY05279.1 hypothetical protein TVAG_020250 [Trichomonas vaginalis G3]KAI5530486.1 hypothetical protein TVAGG3_0338880 [Trichomonas vaginalis G3]|eukprot:XP_001317502.1 hypothetical protein [Trichomonas vaginalis G3]
MSWGSHHEAIKRLEAGAEQGVLTLEGYLKEECYLNALGQHLEKISNFIAKNVPTLIKTAIHLDESNKELNPDRCTKALVSHNSKIIDALVNDTNVVTLLTDSITRDIFYPNYFKILQFAIDSDFLSKVPDPSTFFQNLVKKIDNQCVLQFLIKSISNKFDWLYKVDADKILMDKLNDEEYTVSCCLRLLLCFFDTAETNDLIKRLCTPSNVKLLFEAGIDAPTCLIAEKSFSMLLNIYNFSDTTRPKPDAKSPFQEILEILQENVKPLCDYIIRDQDFLADKRNAVELVYAVIETTSSCPECCFEVARYLFKLFFKQPTNSFLHSAFKDIIKSILALKSDIWANFIDNLGIMQKMIDEHNNMNCITTTYHGFIIEISKEISEKISLTKIELPADWQNFITNTVDPTIKFYKQNYGGYVPKVSNDIILNPHFIEPKTIIDDDFEDVPDGNDSNSDDEEESA